MCETLFRVGTTLVDVVPGFSLRSNPGLRLANAFGVNELSCPRSSSYEKTLPFCSRSRRSSPTFTVHSISDDTRVGSETLLHLLVQQQRVSILLNWCYRVVRCVVAVRLLRGSTTWNEAAVGIRYM